MTASFSGISGKQSSPSEAEPAWEIATLFPAQGQWSGQEYLDLKGNRLVEYSSGHIEVLPMPTMAHQLIVLFLCDALRAFVRMSSLGKVLIAPFRIRLGELKYREPDVMFMSNEHYDRMGEQFWQGADLVMECVSEGDRSRDLETKRIEYAQAGIPEYWIVDPQKSQIVVLKLAGTTYEVHGQFQPGQRATSHLLPGFEVDVAQALAAV